MAKSWELPEKAEKDEVDRVDGLRKKLKPHSKERRASQETGIINEVLGVEGEGGDGGGGVGY